MSGSGALPARARAAWGRLSLRERLMVGGLGLALGAYLVVAFAVQPLVAGREAARAAITGHEAALAQLAAAPMAAPAAAPSTRPVTAVLTETAPAFALAIRRIEPEGAGARVVLEDAEFAAVLVWLEALEREHGIRPVAVEMDRRPEPGTVTARLGLAR